MSFSVDKLPFTFMMCLNMHMRSIYSSDSVRHICQSKKKSSFVRAICCGSLGNVTISICSSTDNAWLLKVMRSRFGGTRSVIYLISLRPHRYRAFSSSLVCCFSGVGRSLYILFQYFLRWWRRWTTKVMTSCECVLSYQKQVSCFSFTFISPHIRGKANTSPRPICP